MYLIAFIITNVLALSYIYFFVHSTSLVLAIIGYLILFMQQLLYSLTALVNHGIAKPNEEMEESQESNLSYSGDCFG